MRTENTHIALLRSRRSQSTTGLVRDAIESMIVEGELAPGVHVAENKLAGTLGVSRGPIREACRALVESGLLVAEANRGFFVRKLSLDDVVGVYDIRASLARLTGQTVAAKSTTEQVRQLGIMVDNMDSAAEAGDAASFYRLNLEFHDLVDEFTGNAKLVEIHKILMRDLQLFRRRGLTDSENLTQSNAEHRRIVRAIAAQDPVAAADEMEAHILKGKQRFLAAMEKDVR